MITPTIHPKNHLVKEIHALTCKNQCASVVLLGRDKTKVIQPAWERKCETDM